jgi:type II secretory pathway pseudopilin PulG
MSSIGRERERGSAMLVTLIVISSLIAGGIVLASMQMQSMRSTRLVRNGLSAEYCAEAGVIAAHQTVALNYSQIGTTLTADPYGTGAQPAWLGDGAFSHDLDGDGSDDFQINIMDDDDENPSNLNQDFNHKVWIKSTCIKYSDTPKQVMELVSVSGGGSCYNAQAGGCDGNNNTN